MSTTAPTFRMRLAVSQEASEPRERPVSATLAKPLARRARTAYQGQRQGDERSRRKAAAGARG
ncbi:MULTISPECIES: hypothetical protein [unclassified Crossiella]|uniref:hypothetical protein n=1 Tax=unclassified Crossiella TaxID=2620835 RepID=UPI001FFE630A|nr:MULTISPECIES: hypothetical protein [unclassified Crossiella]MCK2237156.1 hypothetical protein [Crossiella sp. S99.2]MCK2250824.1 hypothetical protein [Crossiella sp. S99.1]